MLDASWLLCITNLVSPQGQFRMIILLNYIIISYKMPSVITQDSG